MFDLGLDYQFVLNIVFVAVDYWLDFRVLLLGFIWLCRCVVVVF